ncbi:MAG: 4Fe-4S dicluster domain-containing protein [Candidatus Latescibacterota bacterium]|nr:MAG: 4Fe-4S dicluster domain-containing protein [Candidatus Latescibacterota bacterium]
MKEIVVVSGKGGTGKTSLTAAFAALAGRSVIADCDVDAADLHLVLSPRISERHEFRSGRIAIIREDACGGCGACLDRCRFGAIRTDGPAGSGRRYSVDPISCEGCGVCVRFCPQDAIDFPERLAGEWMISETRYGPMVHARLGVAAENSGKLVSTVRREARRIAEERHIPSILVDGPPGIGCPVIASLTGASRAIVIAEPSVSAEHDLGRVLELTRHFEIPVAVCVNKWDLNPAMAERIEEGAARAGALTAGRIRYDPSVVRAQIEERTIVEISAPSAKDVREVWKRVDSWAAAVPAHAHGMEPAEGK